MKTFILQLLLVFSPLFAFARQTDRDRLGGVYYAYHYTPDRQQAAVPAGYQPVALVHYGRHGSRWVTDDIRYERVNDRFADDANLTRLGRAVKKRLQKVWRNARGNGGKLTPLGARQHRQIAARMVKNYPGLFAPGSRVQARSSVADRCVRSMQAFTGSVRRMVKGVRVATVTDSADMRYIAYSSPEEEALLTRTKVRPAVSADRFMKALFVHPGQVHDPLDLMCELHTIATDMQDVELSVNFDDVFTYDEYAALSAANDERMLLCNGATPLNGGIPARSAVSLWVNMRDAADAALAGKGAAVTLRFGHDTSLYRLLTLLGVPVGQAMADIIPMAANVQWVFYRDGRDSVLVTMHHNEHLVRLPLREQSACCYRWSDVKTYMAGRLQQLEWQRRLNDLNTMVGTAQADTRSQGLFGKGSEEHGQTLPAVLRPNGQNFWTPQTQDTEQKCVAPYYYRDSLLQGFRNSHWIVGGCTQDYGSFTVAALGGKLRVQPEERATPFTHAAEQSHPHYYAVELPQEQLTVELTAASHAALLRITPRKDGPVHVVLTPNSDEGRAHISIDTLNRRIYGYNPVHRIYQGWGRPAGFSGHFVLDYGGLTLLDYGTYDAHGIHPQALAVSDEPRIGVYLTFAGKAGVKQVLATASSFTDRQGAEINLKAEAGGVSFEAMVQQGEDAWLQRLGTIDVHSADTALVNQFYGAFYRTSFLPRELSDVDGRYPRFAGGGLGRSACPRYTDYSMWDTYRAVHPLYHIIDPVLSGHMMQSLVDMYTEGGWLPIFPCWNSYTAAMIGDHAAAALADAYIKGVPGVDYAKAYEGMRRNAFESPASADDYRNGMGRRALDSYLKYGYIPMEDSVKEAFHTDEQTSRTLEYAFDDFAVAQLARRFGTEADYRTLMHRAGNWRNVINPRTGYADGRHADGRFENNTDLVHRKSYITEGATCHYTWYVPHDPDGLIAHLGGREAFVRKLDSMFTQGRYWHGNEPCHQVAYLFSYAGRPDLTGKWVRHILQTEYNDTPGGLSGNDDAGQMSAWYVFSAMGFYPVCPATPFYRVGSPLFERVTIRPRQGRTFSFGKNDLGLVVDHGEAFGRGR